jgi:hypothetical protein
MCIGLAAQGGHKDSSPELQALATATLRAMARRGVGTLPLRYVDTQRLMVLSDTLCLARAAQLLLAACFVVPSSACVA